MLANNDTNLNCIDSLKTGFLRYIYKLNDIGSQYKYDAVILFHDMCYRQMKNFTVEGFKLFHFRLKIIKDLIKK